MMNKIYLIGRLTKDPSLTHTKSGIASLRFTLAVNRTINSAKGEKAADFINCISWRLTAENMAKFLKKGSQVLVEGRIETGSYTAKDGTTKFTTDIIASSVQFLDSRTGSPQSQQPTQPIPFPQPQAVNPYQPYPNQPQTMQQGQPPQPTWQQQQAVGQNTWTPQQRSATFNEANLPF